jgi:uncharacterized protein (TIGR02118 family)
MVRMSVYYANQPGVSFDHAYYAGIHRQLVNDRLGPLGCRSVEIDRGLAGYAGGPAPYVAVGHLVFDSLESLERAWAAHGAEIVADVPQYTNAQPVIQISEIAPRALEAGIV